MGAATTSTLVVSRIERMKTTTVNHLLCHTYTKWGTQSPQSLQYIPILLKEKCRTKGPESSCL